MNSISFRSLSNLVPVELRWLATALRPVWTLHAASFLAFTLGSALGLLGPLVLRWLIDRILPERDAWLLVSAVALLFLSYEGRVVSTSLGSWLRRSARTIFCEAATDKRPRLLILDEATSSMDAAVEQVVLDRTRRFLPSSTVLLLSHRVSSVSWADRVIVLEAGKIVRDESTKAISKSDDNPGA